MNRIWQFCFCLLAICTLNINANEIDSLLMDLDKTIQNRPFYIEQKETELINLKKELSLSKTDEARFEILGKLLERYRSFNTDSSLHIARERYQIALHTNRRDYMDNALMNTADVMGTTGMFKEAIDLMRTIHISSLPGYLHPYYYHIYRTIYGLMADYAVTQDEKNQYAQLTDQYRDSLLLVNASNTLPYALVMADQYNVRNNYDESIRLINEYCKNQDFNISHNQAVCSYILAESYRLKGDYENEKKYLLLSSIADIQSAVREYISLRKLAVMYFQEGDVRRAYSYLQVCMDDAIACNARLRILEILKVFPVINEAYRQRAEHQQLQLKWALISISLLSLFLLITIYFVYKQMKRVVIARSEVVASNEQLKKVIGELNHSNDQLKEANHIITEDSYIKEEYIGRYMDQCSVYLEKMDNYRRSLGKIAVSGKVEELYQHIRSTKFIEDELKEFYFNFDNTFLQLFPTFITDFNKLLAEGEKIYPKPNERLNAELRIFALIRLGITDSVKIAQFLRYSVTTIYNYRTKVRNKAAGNRDELEKQVMQIGTLKK